MLCPARIVRVNKSIASGSISSNFFIRRDLTFKMYTTGKKPRITEKRIRRKNIIPNSEVSRKQHTPEKKRRTTEKKTRGKKTTPNREARRKNPPPSPTHTQKTPAAGYFKSPSSIGVCTRRSTPTHVTRSPKNANCPRCSLRSS